MTIPRFIIAVFTAGLLLVSPIVAAEPPVSEPGLKDIITRLDKILQRIDRLEQRIAQLEGVIFPINGQPDKHGILRDATGRPIGIWGIDYPGIQEQTRR